jgi:glycosyltransferase involved in cell wall biosynthesis
MTKLIIQIPCYNEEESLPITLADLPKEIPGIDSIEWLIINDGSTDSTIEQAKKHGVQHIVDLPQNQGLARAFMAGIEASVKAGADIIVNTDADNQYNANDIQKLVKPILDRKAEFVVGARPINEIGHFSITKRWLQKIGSWAVRVLSGTDIPDAPSGFRALTRDAALKINVFNSYTYTLETIIQAGRKGISITSVPIRVNAELRPSRLVKSTSNYIRKSVIVMIRVFILYQPLRFFLILGSIPFFLGLITGIRWLALVYIFVDPSRSYVPSLILATTLMLIGFQTWIFGFLADILAANRQLLEDIQLRQKKAELNKKTD